MFKIVLVAILLQISSHKGTCLEVLPNNTSDSLASTRPKNTSLSDSNNNTITRRQNKGDINHDVRRKHYTS